MAVTIKDVAREARVSVASVSRALNGSASVTQVTREHILRVAARMHYVPHSAARSLITRRTQTIGALLPDLFGEFFSELIRGIDLAARARGLHLLVSSSHGDASEAAAALRAMRGRVDGLLIMSPHIDSTFLRDNLPDSVPAVLMNTASAEQRFPTLCIDNFGGAYAMTEHLIVRHGYRHIVLIGGPEDNFDASERRRGFEQALAASKLQVQSQILPGNFTEESGYRAGQQVLNMRRRPQAVFASNDTMAVGCLFALTEAGLQVPTDIALVGFDDIPIAPFVNPPLTTVRVRIANLGRSALDQLAKRLEDSESKLEPAQTLACEIVVRSSCGRIAVDGVRQNDKTV